VKENNLAPLPEGFTGTDRLGFRFLQGCLWNNEAAYKEIFLYDAWRKETYPLHADDFKHFLDSGAVYAQTRCKEGHQPVIIINMLRFKALGRPHTELAQFAYFFFDQVVTSMMVPGHIENWFVIIDFKGLGVTDLPINELKGFVAALQRNFRGRMSRMIVANTPALIRGAWSIIYSWLDKFVQQKITVTADPAKALKEYIHEDDLEETYGGNAPVRTCFWPI